MKDGEISVKRLAAVFLCIGIFIMLTGCSVQKLDREKMREIEFTVVEEEEIPEELKTVIREKENTPFKVTYADEAALYIAQGYGSQKTSGYSIEVKECYETKNAVYIHTNLIGPSKEEKIVEAETFPYIVIKMEFIDKHVVFK